MQVSATFGASNTSLAATTDVTNEEDAISNIVNLIFPCPRQMWEFVGGVCSGVLILASNVACINFLRNNRMPQHPENYFYVINLAVSNLLCGAALLGVNLLNIVVHNAAVEFNVDRCYKMCAIVGPVFIFSIMSPYVALATLGIDIACYCHLSIDYQRRISQRKVFVIIASGWLYALIVVVTAATVHPQILCDKFHWELSFLFAIFPILLMFLPAVCVVIIFTHVMWKYWKNSQNMDKCLNIKSCAGESKSRLARRFLRRFIHLVVFSILCGVVYTTLVVIEVVIEAKTHNRICALYRVDRIFIALNSFFTPWMQCLTCKEFRKKLLQKYCARWRTNQMVPVSFPASKRNEPAGVCTKAFSCSSLTTAS